MSKKNNVNIEIPEPITGEDVFKWRKERGFTRGKLGELLCGTSWECVKSWENFRHEPPKLLRLALDHLAMVHPVKFTLDENGVKTTI
jgi:DNA-binding transcriptional regulator YiaG